ncbi:MAG: hypothetical protein GY769_25790 [bacterium]|nr:hypothetical protein [bacterium]
MPSPEITKITVHIPADLLKKARKSTGQGITETVREGLRLVAARQAFEELRMLKGKVKVPIDLDALREDRS